MSDRASPLFVRYAARIASQSTGYPASKVWLADAEQDELAGYQAPKRREDWLAGRWLSKQLISQATDAMPFDDIEIRSRDHAGLGMQPSVRLRGCLQPWRLSIAHTDNGVLVGLALNNRVSLGVDLVHEVPNDPNFRSMWFTPDEQRWLEEAPQVRTQLIWGLKEAIFKACGAERLWTPREINVLANSDGTYRVKFFGRDLVPSRVHFRRVGHGLAVMICFPCTSTPSSTGNSEIALQAISSTHSHEHAILA